MSADEQSLEAQIRALLRSPAQAPEAGSVPAAQNDGSCVLVVHYYGGRSEYRCDTVREAAQRAISMLASPDAWPVQIRQDGAVLWEMPEDADSRESLEHLHESYG